MSDKYIGDFKKGQVLRVKFNTFSQAILPATPSVNPTVAIYKDSATEFTTGVTQPSVDFDGKAGFHELVIDTSDAVYEIGKDYDIVFTAGTVDSKDLTRTILRTFSIENRNVDANVTKIAGQTAIAAAPVSFPTSVANESTVSNRPTLTQIEGSTVLAKDSTVAKDATVAKDSTVAKDATVAKESTANSILPAIQNLNNLSAKMNIFGSPLLEIPDAGSTVYAFTVVVKDDEDKLVNLDASPTVTAANAGGTSRSGNLSAVANPSTGRYTFTYTVASTHPSESLRIAVSGAVSTEPRYIEWIGAVVDYDTLTVLQQISTDLATKPTLVQIEASTVLAKASAVTASAIRSAIGMANPIFDAAIDAVLNEAASANAQAAEANSKAGTLLARITSGVASMFADLIAMINGTGVSPRWSANALSLAPTGGGGGGTGTGARAVSITVLDNLASPIQSATVRVSRSGQTFAAQTNASGLASFSLDDATWTVSITSPGYSFAPVSLVVGGTVSQTYSMTPIAPTPPAPFTGLCNVQFSVIHLGIPVPSASVVATLEEENPTVDNYLISRQVTSGVTDANGNCVLTMVQFSQFTRGGVYRIKVADPLGRTIHDRRVKIPSTATANAEDLLDAR
jgi:hypothetical protein